MPGPVNPRDHVQVSQTATELFIDVASQLRDKKKKEKKDDTKRMAKL